MNTRTIDMMTVVTHGNEHVATEIDMPGGDDERGAGKIL